MKGNDKLETSFPELSVTNEIDDCQQVIKDVQSASYRKAAIAMRQLAGFSSHTPCVMEKLRSHRWADDFLLEVVYETSENSSAAEKLKKVKEVDSSNDKVLTDSIRSCLYEKEFGKVFEEFFKKDDSSSSSEEDDDATEDYCARKYVVEKNLVDSAVYTVVLNPKGLKVENINCEVIIRKAFKEIQELLSKTFKEDDDLALSDKETECFMGKYREGNFLDRVLYIGVLSELDITEEQKLAEKKEFIDLMIQLTDSLLTCK